MIAQVKQIEQADINSIYKIVVEETGRKYSWLDELEDCKNYLKQKLPLILTASSFATCDHPKAYLKKSLRNEANRFYQSRMKQLNGIITNQEVSSLSQENGMFRDKQNRFNSKNVGLQMDVQDFLTRSSRMDQRVCLGIMKGETFESIGDQLGISKQAVHKLKTKILNRAKHQLMEYKNDRR